MHHMRGASTSVGGATVARGCATCASGALSGPSSARRLACARSRLALVRDKMQITARSSAKPWPRCGSEALGAARPGCIGQPAPARRAPTRLAAAVGFADAGGAGSLPLPSLGSLLRPLAKFFEAQYLPVALVSALVLGATNPSLGLAAAGMQVPAVATFGIFLVQVGARACSLKYIGAFAGL